MILLAPRVAAFLPQRLPIERPPSELQLEQLDAPLIVNFLNHLETSRGNGAGSRNIRLAAIKSFMHYMKYRVPSAARRPMRPADAPPLGMIRSLAYFLPRD